MQRRYKYQDVVRFNEIADILKVDFDLAAELVRAINEKSPYQRYQEMIMAESAVRDPDMLVSDKRNRLIEDYLDYIDENKEILP